MKNATFQQVRAVITARTGQANLITIPRELVRFFEGDYVAAGMMAQLIYWDDKTADPEGWIYKTAQQWDEELCLSEYQVRRGAGVLARRGYAARSFRKNPEYRNGTTPIWHYLTDMETFIAEFTQFLEGQQIRGSSFSTPDLAVSSPPDIEETATSSITTKPTDPKPTTTKGRRAAGAAGDAASAAGGGAQGDCSHKTESYAYLMAIHHTYPTNFTQPNGRNARKFADVPLAVVKDFTKECASRGLGTGLLLHKLQDYLDNPPPPADAAPRDAFAGWASATAPAEEETYTFDRPGYFPADLWGTLDGDQQAVFAAVVPAAGDWDYANPDRPWPDALWLVRGRYRDIAAQVAATGGAR